MNPVDADADALHAGEPRVVGDVVEIPLYEEVLVKKRVLREIVRVSKRRVVERRVVSADLRREDVEIEGDESPA